MLYNDIIKCFQRRSCPKQGKKKHWYKVFLLKHIVRFGTGKNFISNLSIKIYLLNELVNAYAYRMLLRFKAKVTYAIFFNFTDNCVHCEAAFVGHNSNF